MKKLLCLLTLVLTILGSSKALGDDIYCGGRTRNYIKYIPENLGPKRPLLISMHGMNQDANYQKGMLQIEAIADTAKFAVIFPEGINRSWDISGQSDINFVLALIDEMADKYDIDKDRVYLSGFSMGGMFTYHAMNHIADRIAAFAPISGYPMGGQTCTSARPVPIIHTHGTGDDVVSFDGVQRSLQGWIERNDCGTTPLVTDEYRTRICTRYQWGPGDEGAEVVLIQLSDKGHWISNEGFYTGEEIWNFCKRYKLNDPKPQVAITYPKAGTDFISMGKTKEIKVHVEAKATPIDAEIANVSIYGDNQLITTLTEAPYSLDWDVASGTHLITVVATDTEGKSIARAIPIKAKSVRNSLQMYTDFDDSNIVPNGWLTYDGRTLRVGELTGVSSGGRVMSFTGSPRDFDYGMYVRNSAGTPRKGYAAYADKRTTVSLMLTAGTYELSFLTCNFNMPEHGEVTASIYNADTDELIAETSITPECNIGNSRKSAFSGSSNVVLPFVVPEDTFCKIFFYAADSTGSDAVIAKPKLLKKSADGIEAIDIEMESPVAVEYYDMTGRKVIAPKGLVIRRAVYADGHVTSSKVILK